MLRTAFTTLPDVDCVLLALPADARPFAPLKETFKPLQRLTGGNPRTLALAPALAPTQTPTLTPTLTLTLTPDPDPRWAMRSHASLPAST